MKRENKGRKIKVVRENRNRENMREYIFEENECYQKN